VLNPLYMDRMRCLEASEYTKYLTLFSKEF